VSTPRLEAPNASELAWIAENVAKATATNFVAKRWESGEAAFLAATGARMIADITRLRGAR
jgi:hypothetical protein